MAEHVRRILVVGIPPNGPDGLPPAILKRIAEAEVLCGGKRQLALFPGIGKERWPIQKDLNQFVQQLRKADGERSIVVLASGDPLLFGIGAYLRKHFPTERLEFIPHVSAVQEAFARIGEPWDNAVIVSVHARPIELAIEAVWRHHKVAILTDDVNMPARLAEKLLAVGVEDCRMVVAEDLGLPTERVTDATLASIARSNFSPLNVVLILRQERPRHVLLGIPDAELAHRDGMITKQEVRAISLWRLGLTEDSVVWDVGAGSGAISIEAARLARHGRVFAIERDLRQMEFLEENLRRWSCPNVSLVFGEAPGILSTLPEPDAVLIGGSGGKLTEILNQSWDRLREGGRVVANLVLIDHLTEAWAWARRVRATPEVTLVQFSRGLPLSDSFRFEGATPVYILQVVRRADR
jgi:precorrin-6B C5,15-methyltransferase / cobalt-precorrin-6B C5,C15-methyltransferase